jgi:5-methylcytosine-specific restriction endonuclease McrBC regulatory subunit McrC
LCNEKKQNCESIFIWNSNNSIKTTSIVGTIKIDDELTIEVLPKAFKNSSIEEARKNLFYLVEISKYPELAFENIQIEENIEDIPYLELLIKQFTSNLLGELQKGIYAEYIEKIEKSSFVRGAIQPHLQDPFDKSKIVCKFREFSFNNRLMQILKTVAEALLRNVSLDFSIRRDLFEITTLLDEVDEIEKLKESDFDEYYFNRLNEAFEDVFYQAKIIYFEYLPFHSDENEDNKFFSIFFDMDFLFEKFVAHLLYKSNFEVEEQKKLWIYKDKYVTPDFILYKERIVIDSKYKKFYGINSVKSDDIYQITNYMDNLGFENGTLVMYSNSNDETFFENQMQGKHFNVITLDLERNIEDVIENFRFIIQDNGRLDFSFDYKNLDDKNKLENDIDFKEQWILFKKAKKEENFIKALDHLKALEQENLSIFRKKGKFSNNSNYLETIYYSYGKIFSFDLKNNEKAIESFTKAMEFASSKDDESLYLKRRGYSYRNSFKYEKAILDWKEAIKLNSEFKKELEKEIDDLQKNKKHY